ncbi:MAG: hypothetical protein M1830_000988 [Pleopsidium flavum]|nr:MAG: hypothetical protein M1830_000988 [Pleopsidium flavum]
MTEALPKGLVTNSEAITGDIERIDHVAIEDIAQLWKVYTTNRVVLNDLVGLRLEYLFWRIWSSPRIHRNIRGSTIAKEFLRISEGPSFIRTTPTQSPTSGRRLPDVRPDLPSPQYRPDTDAPSNSTPVQKPVTSVSPTPSPAPESQDTRQIISEESYIPLEEVSDVDEVPAPLRKEPKSVTFLPPILKKPRAGSQNQLPKTARVVSPAFGEPTGGRLPLQVTSTTSDPEVGSQTAPSKGPEGLFPANGTYASPTYPLPPSTPPFQGVGKEPLQRVSKRRTTFVVNTASNRRRPSAVRRKSSQSSSGSASKVASPRLAAQAQEKTIPESPIAELSHNSLPEPTGNALSPLSRSLLLAAVQTEHSHLGGASSATEIAAERPPQDWLVDRDFRSKFVDRRHQEHLTTYLTRPVAKAAAAAAAAASFQATGMMDFSEHPPSTDKGKGKVEIVPLKPEVPSNSAATENNEVSPAAPLPRSKSQLSLLLDRDRRLSEGNKRGHDRERHRKSSS